MPADPRILFLHPVALDHRAASWIDLPGVVAPSLPGHGDRSRRAGWQLDDVVDEIVGWMPEPVHVVGCSMGGMIAMRLALRHPHLVRSLVLGFTTARIPREIMMARAEETETRPPAEMVDETLRRWFSSDALAADDTLSGVQYARERLLATDRQCIADAWRAIAEHDVLDELPALRVPTTCVAGEHDLSTPLPAVEAIATSVPDAELVVMDGPHMGFLESPDMFTGIVRDHLHRVERA